MISETLSVLGCGPQAHFVQKMMPLPLLYPAGTHVFSNDDIFLNIQIKYEKSIL